MPIIKTFGPNLANVGAYARAGAAGVAAREDMWRGAQMAQSWNLQQQHMGLQRESLYATHIARLADQRMQAYQFDATRQDRKAESEADRTHAREMQSSAFDNSMTYADAAAKRELETRNAIADREIKDKQVLYDYELTKQGEIANAKANNALEVVRRMHKAGELGDEDRIAAELAIEADRNGIEKMPVPKKKVPTLRHRLYGDDPDGKVVGSLLKTDDGVFFEQPDGQIDFRPSKAEKPILSPDTYLKMRVDIAERLTTYSKDKNGNELATRPSPDAVEREVEAGLQGYERFVARQEQANAPPISQAAVSPNGIPQQAPPAPSPAPQQAPAPAPQMPQQPPVQQQPAPPPPKGKFQIRPKPGLDPAVAQNMLNSLEKWSRIPPDQLQPGERAAMIFFSRQLGIPGI